MNIFEMIREGKTLSTEVASWDDTLFSIRATQPVCGTEGRRLYDENFLTLMMDKEVGGKLLLSLTKTLASMHTEDSFGDLMNEVTNIYHSHEWPEMEEVTYVTSPPPMCPDEDAVVAAQHKETEA